MPDVPADRCDCPTCTAIRNKPIPGDEMPLVNTSSAAVAAGPEPAPEQREVPTTYPLTGGQLDPATPREPVQEAPAPIADDRERELERLRLLVRNGGAVGSAERLAHLNHRPDHSKGL